MKKIIYLIYLVVTFIATDVGAYFGLTRRTQLSDVWTIDLDAAALATADHFANWERDMEGLHPSLDYKPIDMSLDPVEPIPRKRMRGKKVTSSRNPMSHSQTDIQLDDNTSDSSTTSSRQHRERSTHSEKGFNRHYDNQRSRYFGKRSSRRHSHNQSPTRRAIPNRHPQTTINSRNQNKVSSKQNTSTSLYKRNVTSPEELNESFLDKINDRTDKTHSNPEMQTLARDLDIIMDASSSVPRIRHGRESGKRHLVGMSQKTQNFLISSHVDQSLSPSEVQIQSDLVEDIHAKIDKSKKTLKHANRTSSTSIGHLFHLNDNVFSSHAVFSKSNSENATKLVESQKIDKKEARKLCDSFKLTSYQRRKCRKDSGLPQVLAKATHIAAAECMYRFRYERWNCSLGSSRLHLLDKGNKETAFLYSISSAGLTYSVARACADGHMESCSCEESFTDNVNQEAWLWGGCGDNVHYAAKFVKKFLRSNGDNMDVRAEIDRHNSDLGIRFVKSNVRQKCKCHGVSGSCTTKSCWRKMDEFYKIGRKIKRAYDRAVKVENTSNSSGKPQLVRIKNKRWSQNTEKKTRSRRLSQKKRKGKSKGDEKFSRNNHRTRATAEIADSDQNDGFWNKAPRKKELVYLESSPRYCKKTKYSFGTKGRICGTESNCERMCCGRGYTTHIRIIRRTCDCEVKWCCYVQCKTCNERVEIRTCV